MTDTSSKTTKASPSGLSLLFHSESKPPNAYAITTPTQQQYDPISSSYPPSSSYFTASSVPNSLSDQPMSLSPPFYDAMDINILSRTTTTTSSSSYFDDQSIYEVILDDGTRHKRTISLSTIQPELISRHSTSLPKKSTETSPLLTKKYKTLFTKYNNDQSREDMAETRKLNTQQSRRFFQLSDQQKMVLKCSLAYTIGSLFTFVPWLNALCGPHVASHLAATVTVFFSPSKTVGGMIETAGLGWLYTLAALGLSLGSMYTTDYFLENQMPWTAYTLSLGFWLAGSIYLISYLKVKYNKPSVLTASGLACIILIIVIVKQGSGNEADFNVDIIVETFVIVAIGSVISFAVCVLIWPMTAFKKLKTNIDASLSSTRTLLKLLTKTFLLDDDLPHFTANTALENALKAHTTSFVTLRPVLKEATLEFYNLEIMRHAKGYQHIVESLERLAQHINGLKSSCRLQVEVMQSTKGSDQQRAGHENKASLDPNESEQDALLQFMSSVRLPMKSLAYTCKQTMIHLQDYFMDRATDHTSSFYLLRQNLASAIDLFEVSQSQALIRFYRKRSSRPIDIQRLHALFLTQKEVPMDDIYLVYFFVFCLLELAKELMVLLACVQYVFEDMQELNENQNIFQRLYRLFIRHHDVYPLDNTKIPLSSDEKSFVPNNRNTLHTLHTPAPKTHIRRYLVHLWGFLSQFGTYRVKFAIKSMVTAVLISALAFIPTTRPYFTSFKLEWTLITVMAVMSPTVGATNMSAALRVLATTVGCFSAALIYTLFHDHVVLLWCSTWLVSVFSFWMILSHKHGRFGFFGLLAYNLIVLYKHNHRHDPGIDVFELSWTRCVAVSLGVLIGLIVTAYLWPYEARTQVRKGLSDFLLRLSWLYKHLVSVYQDEDSTHALSLLAVVEQNRVRGHVLQQIELGLQIDLFELQSLLAHASNEPRLKGPFPVKKYTDIIVCCQGILDKLMTIRMVVLKDAWAVYVRQGFMVPAAREFMEMSGSVLLYFYLLASALQLKTPLPPYLPPAEKARQQLIQKLQTLSSHLDAMNWPDEKRDECYMIYYAYVVLMESVIRELDMLGVHMKELFGALVPDEEWASYFGRSARDTDRLLE